MRRRSENLPAKEPAASDVHPALIEPLRPWDPERIGGFALIGRLGAGAMGRIYLGRSTAGRLVAVKTIRTEFADESDFRTRFAHEVAAARRVSGAFTAPVVAADPEADVPWLATAYVPAPPLSALVTHGGPLPVPAVRWLAAGCAEALESIHGVGLVHRDLKPSNVLVSPDGPRVIDYGVARATERISLTLTRGAVGTPVYMAPEQARDTSRATTASDVYSLGATILFAATGHGPYQGDSVMDVLVQLATEDPDLSGLPAELIDVVVACLERDPKRRPSSASVLAHLAPGDGAAGADDFGRAPLPTSALAFIDGYRHEPRATSQPAGAADADDTLGSLPLASAPRKASARHSARPRAAGSASAAISSRSGRTRPEHGRRSRMLFGLATTTSAIALLAIGAAVGKYLIADGPAQASGNSGKSIENVTHRSGNYPPPPSGGPPTFPATPPPDPGKEPVIALNQQAGDTTTSFVVQGRGWIPGRPITVTLIGARTMTIRTAVIVDLAGTFSYAINQTHEFYPAGLPLGRYRVIITEFGSKQESVRFQVINPLPPSPPPSPPPGT